MRKMLMKHRIGEVRAECWIEPDDDTMPADSWYSTGEPLSAGHWLVRRLAGRKWLSQNLAQFYLLDCNGQWYRGDGQRCENPEEHASDELLWEPAPYLWVAVRARTLEEAVEKYRWRERLTAGLARYFAITCEVSVADSKLASRTLWGLSSDQLSNRYKFAGMVISATFDEARRQLIHLMAWGHRLRGFQGYRRASK